jgi:hypothetical protein
MWVRPGMGTEWWTIPRLIKIELSSFIYVGVSIYGKRFGSKIA